MICLVGGCPSSGSTLLSDLLDSTPFTASGPELEFYCNPKIYDYSSFKKNFRNTGKLFSVRSTGIYFRNDLLQEYGYTHEDWKNLLEESESITQFTKAFTNRFLAFRKKEINGIVFEKTPQNANCIGEFLETFPNSYYIHIVRNPANVFSSLRKRGFGTYTSAATWLLYAAKAQVYANHPRFLQISYEELIANPFVVVQTLLNKIAPNHIISVKEIQSFFENNRYRQNVSGISTWENQNRSTVNANQKKVSPEEKQLLSSFLTSEVGKSYSSLFKLSPISFQEALKQNGYQDLFKELSSFKQTTMPKRTFKEYQKLATKWLKGVALGNYKLVDAYSLFNTLESKSD